MQRWLDKGWHRAAMILLAAIGLLSASAALAQPAAAQSGEPSRHPVLRIETGMHTARIASIGIDRLALCFATRALVSA